MTLTVRRLEPADAPAALRLGWEAFGVPPGADLTGATVEGPGYVWFGAFDDDDGTLVATAADRAYDTWFGGRTVPTCGVASVTVAAEYRGAGAIGPLMRAMLTAARERGAVLSTLFPSAPRIYRRLGYEVITSIGHVLVPSTALAAVAASGTTVRRAGAADAAAIRGLYDRWAAGQNGPLTRRGPSFPGADDDDIVHSFTGVTLAIDEGGEPTGYASWIRGRGDDVERALEVVDLIAVDADATRALLRTLGSFSSVVGDVRLRTSGTDPVRLLLPTTAWSPVHEELYMLAVLDVEAALDGLLVSPGLAATLGFTLSGSALDGLDGSYQLTAGEGVLRCGRDPVGDDRSLDPRGVALLYAGAAPSGELRALGLLRGGDPADDATWDALFAGRRPHVRDQF